MKRRVALGLLGLAIFGVAAACVYWLPARVPMRSEQFDLAGSARAKCLLVLLPGAGDDATAFRKRGFVGTVQSRHLSVDVVSADATIGYYFKNTVFDRLAADVIGPARARGYEHTWLAGISMGGLGALVYARKHPGEIDGVFAMAPYLGDKPILDSVESGGGLASWHAPPRVEEIDQDNYQPELWRWLQAVTKGSEPGPVLYLGFADDDQRVPRDRLLANALPVDHVFETAGGHDWGPWMEQWRRFLEQSEFATNCAP